MPGVVGLLVEGGCEKYIKEVISSDFASFTDFLSFMGNLVS